MEVVAAEYDAYRPHGLRVRHRALPVNDIPI
jgi:hypothetical protein